MSQVCSIDLINQKRNSLYVLSVNRENSIKQIPVVRRTVIVEPYPAEPSSQIVVTPRTDTIGTFRSDDNQKINDDNDKILYPTLPLTHKKSKRKKSTTESKDNIIEDLNLEDLNNNEYSSADSRKRRIHKITTHKGITNAFYNA